MHTVECTHGSRHGSLQRQPPLISAIPDSAANPIGQSQKVQKALCGNEHLRSANPTTQRRADKDFFSFFFFLFQIVFFEGPEIVLQMKCCGGAS